MLRAVSRIALVCCLSLSLWAVAPVVDAAARARWLWPVHGAVVGRFAVTADRFAAGQRRGIDIAATPGAAVRAACGGRVLFAGVVPEAGRTVTVACGPLNATYLHLESVAVHRGSRVVPGAPLGAVGPSGRLRLGARVRARNFGYVDPLTLLGADPPGSPPAVGPRGPLGRVPRIAFPAVARVPAHPVAVRAPAGLPLGWVWLPAGFALLIGLAALTAAGRLRAAGSNLGTQASARLRRGSAALKRRVVN